MIISSINKKYSYNKYPQFKGNYRTVHQNNGEVLYRTTTYFYRVDLDWDKLTDFLAEKYKNESKVNIIDYGCSNGAEAYTLAIQLITKLNKAADKFFPIEAKDIDEVNIQTAQNGNMDVDYWEINEINKHTNGKLETFFDTPKFLYTGYSNDKTIKPKQCLKEKINFSTADIIKDIDNIPTHNTVILCRNLWAYLTSEERTKLADKLNEKLDDSCLVIIGDFDNMNNGICSTQNILFNRNFKRTSIGHVYCKNNNK